MTLRTFIIERDIPDVGALSAEELGAVARASNNVIDGLDVPYHWVQSFVTTNKIYCIHVAPDAETVRKHALRGGLACDRVEEVRAVIDPSSAPPETGGGPA